MIARRDLPDDPMEWKNLDVSFPRLSPDTEASSPQSRAEIFDYVCRESADLDKAKEERLKFLRTAKIGSSKYWLWSYEEEGGTLCFVALQKRWFKTILGLSSADGLSPELYLLADYYEMIYW
jgi:hypothetical protein